MNGIDFSAMFWLLVALQAFGVLSACAARLSEGSACQALLRCIFLGALPLEGAATCVALAIGPGIWVACAASLAIMIITATWDLRVSPDVATL
ncbi:MAG: hypothetical protein LLG00_14160 [Planctomycetaceae bacterium]|nr:hypothetical protein [Planctomycetaceae bacterium]